MDSSATRVLLLRLYKSSQLFRVKYPHRPWNQIFAISLYVYSKTFAFKDLKIKRYRFPAIPLYIYGVFLVKSLSNNRFLIRKMVLTAALFKGIQASSFRLALFLSFIEAFVNQSILISKIFKIVSNSSQLSLLILVIINPFFMLNLPTKFSELSITIIFVGKKKKPK